MAISVRPNPPFQSGTILVPAHTAQWKSFDFFDVTLVTPADDDARQLLDSNEISSVCAGSDSLFVGANDGSVSIISKAWKVARKFQAHESGRVTHMRQVEGTSILVTVAVRPPAARRGRSRASSVR